MRMLIGSMLALQSKSKKTQMKQTCENSEKRTTKVPLDEGRETGVSSFEFIPTEGRH